MKKYKIMKGKNMDNTNVNTERTPESVQPTVREKIRKVFSSKLFIVLIIAIAVSLITGVIDAIQHKPDFTSSIEWVADLLSVDISPILKVLNAAETAVLVGSFIKLVPTLLAIIGLVFILISVKKEEEASIEQFSRGAKLVKVYYLIQTIKMLVFVIGVFALAIAGIIMAAQAGDVSFVLIVIILAIAVIAAGVLLFIDMYYTNNTVHFRTLVPSYASNKNIVQISFFVVVVNYIRVVFSIIGAIRNGGWINAIILSVTLVLINVMLTSYRRTVGAVDVEARKEYVEKLKQAKLAKKAKS